METFRWLLTLVLAAFFLGLSVFNWRAFWRNTVRRGREPAAVPVVAALLGVLAVYVCPLAGSSKAWWVPLILDFGALPYALWLAYATGFGKRP